MENNKIGSDECGSACAQSYKMKHSKYTAYDNRVKSFKQWPKCFVLTDINKFCETGFFYTGVGDKIECFFCGLRLKHWNGGDDPTDQHVIWSPSCVFLKMTIGKESVLQRREKFVVKDEFE